MDVALQMNRAAQISSRQHEHGSTAGRSGGINRFIDGRTIEILPVADRAKLTNIERILTGRSAAFRFAPAETSKIIKLLLAARRRLRRDGLFIGGCLELFGRQFADFHVAEGYFAAVFLQQNVAVRPFAEVGDVLKFTRGDSGAEGR